MVLNLGNAAERLGRGIVTDGITTPVVNTSAYFFKKSADLIDFKVKFLGVLKVLYPRYVIMSGGMLISGIWLSFPSF